MLSLFGVGWVEVGVVTEVFYVLLPNWETTVSDTTAEISSLPFTVSGTMDHRHPHGLYCQHMLLTSAWFQVVV